MRAYLDAILAVIREPTSNLTAAALMVAAVVLIALILIIGVLILLVPPAGQTAGAMPTAPAKRRKKNRMMSRVPAWALTTLLVLVVAVAAAYTYYVTSTDEFCSASCHTMEPAAAAVASSAHSGVSCVRCHEGRAGLTIPAAVLSRTRYLLGAEIGRTPGGATVPASRCLECHFAILEGSVESTAGIRISHKEPLDAGYPCESCHEEAGHPSKAPGRASDMQRCLACHDGRVASAECVTCHLGDPGDAPVADRIYQKTELPPPSCGGCHDQTTCDKCHGLRMPHSAAFINGDHAMAAAFDRKPLCWRCHVKADCGGCHQDFETAHGGPSFKARHKEFEWGLPCNTCHNRHQGSFCARCHGAGR